VRLEVGASSCVVCANLCDFDRLAVLLFISVPFVLSLNKAVMVKFSEECIWE
jgi:hypothetical protein